MLRLKDMRRVEGWTVAVFLALLWLPLLWSLTWRSAAISETERRELAPLPRVTGDVSDWQALPARLNAYYDDHMGLRDTLIRAHAYLKIRWLGASPSDRLVVGKQGWLYLGDREPVAQCRGIAQFTRSDLLRWKEVLVQWRNELAERGITFLVVFVPNKHSIYPEFLPRSLPRVSGNSQLSQLVRFLEKRSDLSVLDLRVPLEAVKAQGRIYHKTDTHWNDLGAYAAYRAILRRLAEQVPALANSAPVPVRRQELEGPGLGLARMVGLETLLSERYVFLHPARPRAAILPEERADYDERTRRQLPLEMGTGDPSLPRALMVRDSFANALIPYLSESFGRILYVWDRSIDPMLVERESPDVVIFEMVERFIGKPPKHNGSLAQAP
jgi:alginate O-acetyltransferase complex protein AlgJ